MENANHWYFTKEELAVTPSRKSGIDAAKELSYRQQAANFIQDMGQRLQVSQLCINTAIVYMHRFYVFHSFTEIHRNNLSVAALFLAAKVEEQPRKLEHVIKVAHICLHKDAPPLDVRSESYAEKQFEVVNNESVLLQTLGFVLAIEHPHTYVVKVCQLVKAPKDLAQTSYFMATTSLHMTTMCLQYKPTIVACVCLHLACKWSDWKISPCSEGKEWYYYVDKTVTYDLLERLTQDYISILECSPHKFKKKCFPPKHGEALLHAQRSMMEESSKNHSSDNNRNFTIKKELPSPSSGSAPPFGLAQFRVENSSSSSAPSSTTTNTTTIKMEPNTTTIKVEPNTATKNSETPSKKVKDSSQCISIDAYREKKEKERLQKIAPLAPTVLEQRSSSPVVKQQQRVTTTTIKDESDKVVHSLSTSKHSSNSLEPSLHSYNVATKEKRVKSHHGGSSNSGSNNNKEVSHHHQVHSASSVSSSKMNHHIKDSSKVTITSSSKSTTVPHLQRIPSSGDPVVVLERMDVKKSADGITRVGGEIANLTARGSTPAKSDHCNKQAEILSVADPTKSMQNLIPPPPPPSSDAVAIVTKSGKHYHHKHKTNSVVSSSTGGGGSSNNSNSHHHKKNNSPVKDTHKTNGSKETDASAVPSAEKRSSEMVNANSGIKTSAVAAPEMSSSSRHEKRERSKSKHSNSRDKTVTNSEPPQPNLGIKVKIRKEDINKLPERSQKTHHQPTGTTTIKVESPSKKQQHIKIKLPKPPPPESIPIKLVLTKDKSGSGSYCSSHKNERESKKRAHHTSPGAGQHNELQPPSGKYMKLDHHHAQQHSSSSSSVKQSKSRHSSSSSRSSSNTDHQGASSNHVSGGNKLPPTTNDVEKYSSATAQPYYGNQYFPYQVPQKQPPLPPSPPPSYGRSGGGKTNFNHSLPPLPPEPPQ